MDPFWSCVTFVHRSPSLMKNVSSSLDFGTVLNASLQVRTAALASWIQALELVKIIIWFMINRLYRRHWLRRRCQDSRKGVSAETPGVKYRRTKQQTATTRVNKTSLHGEFFLLIVNSRNQWSAWFPEINDRNVSFTSYSPLFLKDEALSLNDQESLMPTVKPAFLQHDVTENDEEHLFDLE